MRIRHKILLGYLALIAASVVLVVFFLITLSEINNRYSDLINRGQQILLQANNLRSGVQRQIVAARTYEQIGDLSLLVEYEAAVNEQEQAIAQITPLLTQKQDLDTINNIKTASLNYTALARQTMTMARSDKDPITLATKRQQGETARLALQNAADSLIVKEDQQVEASQAAVKTRVDEVSTQLLLSSLVGVLAAIIAATLLTEGFTAPLRRLMRNIQGISSGDLETAVAIRSTDEIGELAAVLETMRQRLAGASAEKEALLNSAREEAEKLTNAQQELEEANNELQEALAVESEARRHIEEIDRLKSEFASMISHELKTPVSYVYNYAGALKEHNNNLNEGQRTEFLTAIQGEAQHLLTLIDDIMAISLLEAGALKHRFVETDLRKIADSVVKDQQLTTRRHALTTIGPESLPVRADPARLKQVLNNLISNAIKYSPQGGAVEVRLRANRLDNTAIIYVRDQGIGIEPADVPKLFDRFTRIQRKETMAIPGSGMGLYIAHHIVEAHGGTLTLQPAPGKGTIAEVTVPLLVERPNSGGDSAQNGHSKQKAGPLADIAHQANGNGNGTTDKEKIATVISNSSDRDTNKVGAEKSKELIS